MPAGQLEVIIAEGRKLKDEDLVGQNDAYVELYLDKKYKQRTATISNTNNPVWNERFTFNLQKGDDTIHFHVFDADVGDKDSIGSAKVKLKNVFDDGRFDEWVKLPANFGLSSHGEIHVIMRFTVSRDDQRYEQQSHFSVLLAIIINHWPNTIRMNLTRIPLYRINNLA